MTAAAETVAKAAMALSEKERADLVAKLLDTLGNDPAADSTDINASWIAEAKRRSEAYRRGETKGVPIEEVLGSLRSRMQK